MIYKHDIQIDSPVLIVNSKIAYQTGRHPTGETCLREFEPQGTGIVSLVSYLAAASPPATNCARGL